MRSAQVKSRALLIGEGGGITREKGKLLARASGGEGRSGVAIRQVSQKKAIGPDGKVSIKTFDPRAAWSKGGIQKPNNPQFHRGAPFLLPKAAFATRNLLSGWIRFLARALSAS